MIASELKLDDNRTMKIEYRNKSNNKLIEEKKNAKVLRILIETCMSFTPIMLPA